MQSPICFFQIGSFFMINLCLVVIATQFSETKRRETAKMKAERARFQVRHSFDLVRMKQAQQSRIVGFFSIFFYARSIVLIYSAKWMRNGFQLRNLLTFVPVFFCVSVFFHTVKPHQFRDHKLLSPNH